MALLSSVVTTGVGDTPQVAGNKLNYNDQALNTDVIAAANTAGNAVLTANTALTNSVTALTEVSTATDAANAATAAANAATASVTAISGYVFNAKKYYLDPRDYSNVFGLPVFDNTGATDMTTLFQYMINDSLNSASPNYRKPIQCPPGQYQVSSLCLYRTNVSRATAYQDCVVFTGVPGNSKASTSAQNYTMPVVFQSNSNSNPVFLIDSTRGTYLGNISIIGTNTAPVSQTVNDIVANYVGTCRNANKSPYCAIAVDGTNSAIPTDGTGGVAANTGGLNGWQSLPGGYYGSTSNGSSYLTFDNIHITQFVVGVAHGVSGQGSMSDETLYRRVYIQYCDTCWIVGHSQAKIVTLEQCTFFNSRVGIDNNTYGVGQGVPPYVNRPHFELVFRALNMRCDWGSMAIDGFYSEGLICLGTWGNSFTTRRGALTVTGGTMGISCEQQQAGRYTQPLFLECQGPVSFRGIELVTYGTGNAIIQPDAWNIYSSGPSVTWDNCSICGGKSANTMPFFGLQSTTGSPITRFSNVFVPSPSGTFQYSDITERSNSIPASSSRLRAFHGMQRMAVGKTVYEFVPFNTSAYASVSTTSAWGNSQAGTFPQIITFTCTYSGTVGDIQVGDIVCWRLLPVNGSSNQFIGPAVKVSAVAGSAISLASFFDPVYYDTTYAPTSLSIVIPPWAPSAALTATYTSGANTLTLAGATTATKNGDWIASDQTGFNGNQRIVSGGGTTAVVMNRNASATSTGSANIYSGRLFVNTQTAAF